ncbi:hypothetical protein [Campylobacter portucalensis]|nr:hypothetical protein [Campylobacter portucalensis]
MIGGSNIINIEKEEPKSKNIKVGKQQLVASNALIKALIISQIPYFFY